MRDDGTFSADLDSAEMRAIEVLRLLAIRSFGYKSDSREPGVGPVDADNNFGNDPSETAISGGESGAPSGSCTAQITTLEDASRYTLLTAAHMLLCLRRASGSAAAAPPFLGFLLSDPTRVATAATALILLAKRVSRREGTDETIDVLVAAASSLSPFAGPADALPPLAVTGCAGPADDPMSLGARRYAAVECKGAACEHEWFLEVLPTLHASMRRQLLSQRLRLRQLWRRWRQRCVPAIELSSPSESPLRQLARDCGGKGGSADAAPGARCAHSRSLVPFREEVRTAFEFWRRRALDPFHREERRLWRLFVGASVTAMRRRRARRRVVLRDSFQLWAHVFVKRAREIRVANSAFCELWLQTCFARWRAALLCSLANKTAAHHLARTALLQWKLRYFRRVQFATLLNLRSRTFFIWVHRMRWNRLMERRRVAVLRQALSAWRTEVRFEVWDRSCELASSSGRFAQRSAASAAAAVLLKWKRAWEYRAARRVWLHRHVWLHWKGRVAQNARRRSLRAAAAACRKGLLKHVALSRWVARLAARRQERRESAEGTTRLQRADHFRKRRFFAHWRSQATYVHAMRAAVGHAQQRLRVVRRGAVFLRWRGILIHARVLATHGASQRRFWMLRGALTKWIRRAYLSGRARAAKERTVAQVIIPRATKRRCLRRWWSRLVVACAAADVARADSLHRTSVAKSVLVRWWRKWFAVRSVSLRAQRSIAPSLLSGASAASSDGDVRALPRGGGGGGGERRDGLNQSSKFAFAAEPTGVPGSLGDSYSNGDESSPTPRTRVAGVAVSHFEDESQATAAAQRAIQVLRELRVGAGLELRRRPHATAGDVSFLKGLLAVRRHSQPSSPGVAPRNGEGGPMRHASQQRPPVDDGCAARRRLNFEISDSPAMDSSGSPGSTTLEADFADDGEVCYGADGPCGSREEPGELEVESCTSVESLDAMRFWASQS